jgi:hypothetical protein
MISGFTHHPLLTAARLLVLLGRLNSFFNERCEETRQRNPLIYRQVSRLTQ